MPPAISHMHGAAHARASANDGFPLAAALEKAALGALGALPPELARAVSIAALRSGLWKPRARPLDGAEAAVLRTRLWGLVFSSPIGIAAGVDKDGVAFDPMLAAGAAFVEVGTVTPRPQRGAPRPRLFRLAEDDAVINRLGFPGEGMKAAAARLARRRPGRGVVGVNIGPNGDSGDWTKDYVESFDMLSPHADYVAINVSSPNTPGLRGLQTRDALARLVEALRARRERLGLRCPLLVKLSPDLEDGDARGVARLALAEAFDGLIVANTTVRRPPGLRGRHRGERGGLSGRPLFAPSTALLAEISARTEGRVPLVGVGGVFGADDAYAKIRAGASLVQICTAVKYRGLGILDPVRRGLAGALAADGFANAAAAVGAGRRAAP